MSKPIYVIVDKALTTTAGAYSANDVIGGKMSVDVGGNEYGKLVTVILIDDDSQAGDLKVYFFNGATTVFADNAAFAPTAADLKLLVGFLVIAAADYTTVNANDFVINHLQLGEEIPYAQLDGILEAYAVLDGIETYLTTQALTFRFVFEVVE